MTQKISIDFTMRIVEHESSAKVLNFEDRVFFSDTNPSRSYLSWTLLLRLLCENFEKLEK